ncbi:hypothetical protein V8F20_012138 [Naviculisporaceae sp. PSN 640]
MKLLSSLPLLATAAVAVSATPAPPVDDLNVVFQARNFSASCVPHSALCFYSFNAFMPGTMDTIGYDCTGSAIPEVGPRGPTLPEIKEGEGTCPPSSRTFEVVRSKRGLTVIVSVQVSRLSYTRGAHLIPNSQIKTIKGTTPTGNYEAYVGPKEFNLTRID